jgi:hypothetical protein
VTYNATDEEDVEDDDEGPGLGALIGDVRSLAPRYVRRADREYQDIASDDEDVDFTADATVEDPEPELELGDDEEEAEPQTARDAPIEELGPRKRQKVAA